MHFIYFTDNGTELKKPLNINLRKSLNKINL